MAADKGDAIRWRHLAETIRHTSNEGRLGAAGVSQKSTWLASRRYGQDLLRDEIHRRAEDDDVGLVHGLGNVQENFIYGSPSQCLFQTGPPMAHSQDALGQLALLGRQPDRSAY
jgi:hypothetical protein